MKQLFPSAILLVALLLLPTGCQRVDQGTPIPHAVAKSFIPGQTTYLELTAELGPPLEFMDGKRAVAYLWRTKGGDASGPGEVFHLESGPYHLRYHALGLRFDDHGLFQAYSYLSNQDSDQLHQQLNFWAKSNAIASHP